MRHNHNNASDGRLAKDLALKRGNVKKEITQDNERVAQDENLVENVSTTHVKQACKEECESSNTSWTGTDEIDIGIDESRTVRFRNNLFVVSISTCK